MLATTTGGLATPALSKSLPARRCRSGRSGRALRPLRALGESTTGDASGKGSGRSTLAEGSRAAEGGTVADRLLRDMRTRLLNVPDFGRASSSGREERRVDFGSAEVVDKEGQSSIRQGEEDESLIGGKQEECSTCQKSFNANVGDAIRTLRAEIPKMLEEDLTYSIYSDDILLWDRWNAISGIQNYATVFKVLRFISKTLFASSTVDVLRLYQPTPSSLEVRWTVRAKYRMIPWVGAIWLDYRSVYKFDSEGLIYEHQIDNLVANGPSQRVLARSALHALQQISPTPSYFFKSRCGGMFGNL